MRLRQLYEDGRIVKGVNTTPDVGPNEISIQAKKFGNSVDKDGRPPVLHNKVKGGSPNVAFNLGLTEGMILKFQRGEDFDTLHIKPKGKNRVELRGKPGYESGNYDAQDKLHQVLDKLGKAANFAELMNGETVSINPNHPDGERATKTAQDILSTEAQEIGSSTEIYVDMDGVLADFFTEWGKLMKVDNWWNISDKHNIDDALQKIRDTDNFWLDLPLTKNAKNLLNLIKQVKGSYIILSSPLPGDKNSEPHKREWIEKNLSFFPPKQILIRHDKETFATQQDGTPNILIDDYGVNVRKWEANGGVGFKHKDHKFERTAKAIKQHIDQPVDGKKNEARTPRMNPADVTAATIASSKPVSQEELQRIVNKYKSKPPSAIANLVNKVDVATVINIAMMIGAPHLTFIQKFLVKKGIKFSQKQMQKAMAQVESIEENFADGKKKGKSRPGRVKRAGASCNGSVTALRKRAKNASGEKAKMYHWCANMKSGRS